MRRSSAGVLVAASLVGAVPAAAQPAYPSKPINLVIALAAGGAADIIGRALGQRLHEEWGQPVVIENKGGANTQVATSQFIRADRDGHTLLLTAEHTFTVNPSLYAKLAYDPEKDFAPVSGLIAISQALVLHPSVPAKSIVELVALSKSKPMTYASLGAGSGPHLSMTMFQAMTGMKAEPVQYRGGGPALADVIAGHVPMLFIATGLAAEPWKAGKVAVLGIGSEKRLEALPELPAIEETLPGFRASVWFGLFAPGGTPGAIIARLNGSIQRIMAEPAFIARFLTPNFFEPMPGTPEQFAAKIKDDATRWSKVIRDAGLRIEK
jgi:tripartite-type tricarboxylate transporter receptor subunit TctC